MQKVIVIGIDGATPDLIEPWMNDGKLPNLDKIRKRGTWGKLASTIPPFSAPAWTTIVTGCNPGKHSIYGFETTDTVETHLITSSYRKVPALWNYLTNIGLKSIIVNVPGTYPPEKINGVMITGLLTPSEESNFTYPKNIKGKLTEDELGDYELEQLWIEDFPRSYMAKHAPDKLLQRILRQMESRAKVTTNLMKKFDWDFTMVVFRGTDTAQHFLFDKKDLLLSCYQKVDQLVGEMIKTFTDAVFIIVSDHGFESIKKVLCPDNVLYNANLLWPIRDQYNSPISIIWNLTFKIWNQVLRLMPTNTIKRSSFIRMLLFSGSSKDKLIDFSKTRAFSTAEGRGIQIALKDRYGEGIVDSKEYDKLCKEISVIFKDLKDPDTGKKIVEEVYQWDEVYGKQAIDPPDLILKLEKGFASTEGIRGPDGLSSILQSKGEIIPYIFKNDPAGRSGDHAPYGVIFAYGNSIKPGHVVKNISVGDILPIVFAAMGIPIPNSIDGKLFNDVFIEKPTVKIVDWKSYLSNKQILSEGELKKINEIRNMFKH